ncbi:MAG: hypothetical protein CVV64_08285 [Candidatus Wallbacteria bacterium HGW-Wallbacteria-1]|jgi:hypothetical protein|uniref:PKD domain-containing protein n=1 Tax=Candidatus Wallbacteria bacterium HGW-Wallbacteria-1 TaxID=2013854 RepID=A0A2N1PRB8_9BACT|nr:MAG: hypothetical protein CVV64_08285 [Candidatus Wallbacteria bacterium HGW-Wallbacteria-1]
MKQFSIAMIQARKSYICLVSIICLLTFSYAIPAFSQSDFFVATADQSCIDTTGTLISGLQNCGLKNLKVFPGPVISGHGDSRTLEVAKIRGLIQSWGRTTAELTSQQQLSMEVLQSFVTIESMVRKSLALESDSPGSSSSHDSSEMFLRNHELPAIFMDSQNTADFQKPLGSLSTQTSEMLIGKVAIVALFPESDGTYEQSTENWTEEAITSSKASIASAMDFFSRANPDAGLSFVFDYPSSPPSGAPSSTVRCGYEPITRDNFDETYINDIMTRLGHTSGSAYDRLRSLAEAKRIFLDTDWAAVIIVKNNLNAGDGRASAYVFGPAACVFADTQSNVISHETAHIFGALDEYHPDASQSPTSMSGYLYMTNANSQYNDGTGYNDGAGEGLPSLMLNLAETISPFTRIQLGWSDRNGDGIPDPRETTPNITLNSPAGTAPVTITGTATASKYQAVSRNSLALNRISKVQWRINGKTWMDATPTDGDFNSQTEQFTIEIADLPAGTYTAEIIAFNDAGYASSNPAAATLTIPVNSVTDRAPFADFTLFPPTGSTSTSFRMNAWPSSDLESDFTTLQFRWDFESDGIWDTPFSTQPIAYHTFSAQGIKNITLQVKDSSGNTSGKIHQTTVTTAQGPPVPAFRVIGPAESFGTTQPLFSFSAAESWDPDSGSSNLKYRWDFESDGTWDTVLTTETTAMHRYSLPTARISPQHDLQEVGETGYDLCSAGDGKVAVASFYGGIKIWNVSTPASPHIDKNIACSEIMALDHHSGHIYAACQSQGLKTFDIDPLDSSQQTSVITGTFNDVMVSGTTLYCAAGSEGLKIYDITNPAAPSLKSTLSLGSGARNLDLALPYAMVGTDDGNLRIVDCSNILAPTLAGQANSGITNMPQGVLAYGNTLYMGFGSQGMAIFNITSKTAPLKVSVITDIRAKRMAFSGTTLFVATDAFISALDISTPTAPLFTGSTGGLYAVAPMVDGTAGSNILYCGLSYYNFGVYRFHASSPAQSKYWNVLLQVQDAQGNTKTCQRSVWSCPYNHSPQTSFTVTPERGGTLTNFLFDSNGSQDQDKANSWDGMLLTRWDFDGDGNFDTNFSDSNATRYHQYTRTGVYTAICETRDRFRAISRSETKIYVSASGTGRPPVPALTVTPSGTVAPGQQMVLDASATTDPDTSAASLIFKWDLNGDGIYDISGSDKAVVNYTPQLPGDQQITLRVEDNDGLWEYTQALFTVTVDSSGPGSSISSPSDGAVIPSLSQIRGTHWDGQYTITGVSVLLTDGTRYLGPTGWVSSETWVPATLPGPGEWVLSLTGITLENGYSYLTRSKATNSQGTVETPKPGINFVISTSGGPATSCSTPALTDNAELSIAISSSDESATVRLWYKKDGDAAWTDSNLTRSGSGSMAFTLPSTGSWQFYTTGSLDGSSEAPPANADSTTLYRDDLPLAKAIRLTYTSIAGTWFQLNEIEVHGTTSMSAAAKLSVQGATVSATPFGSYTESRLIDGSVTYNSDFVAQNPTLPLKVVLTLSETTFIDHLVHYNDGQYGAHGVTVELSKTGITGPWTLMGIYDGLNLTPGQPNPDTLSLQSRVVINEVYPGPISFVEIRNSGASMVDLTGWKLVTGPFTYTFGNISLQGGAILVLREGDGTSTSTTLFTGLDFPWSFDGPGSVWLADSGNVAMDFLRWGTDTTAVPQGTQWNGANPNPPSLGRSLGRLAGTADTDSGSDWISMNPSSGSVNSSSDTFLISGYVKDENNQPMPSVTLTFTGGGQAVTDANGFYVMTSLAAGSYTVTPSKLGSQFTPVSTAVTLGPDRNGVNFAASPASGTRSVSGTITLSGSGLADVTVTIQGIGSVKTSSTGYFHITGLNPGIYSIVPSRTGYTFTPPSRSADVSTLSAVNQDFTASSGGTGYVVSGHVKTPSGQGLQGVSIEAGAISVRTDSAGFYLLQGLAAGSYSIKPVSVENVFNPPARQVTLGPDAGKIDFTALDNTILSRRLKTRYIKIRYQNFRDANWFQLNEITFYGRSAALAGTTVEALTPSSISSSVEAWPGFGTEKLMDGKIITNGDFALKRSGINELEIIFDMGSEKEIDRLIHINDGSFGAKELEILISNAGPTALFNSIETFPLTTVANGPGSDLLTLTSGKVTINEVKPAGNGWIELKNTGHTVVDLSGWTIAGGGISRTLPQHILDPGTFLLFKGGRGIDDADEIYANTEFIWLPTAQGEAWLKDEKNIGSDFVKWGNSTVLPPDGTSWSTPNPSPPGTGFTLSRSNDSTDTNMGSDFTPMSETPLANNVPTRKLTGIISYTTGSPAIGVSVEISGIGSILTDQNGQYSRNLAPGQYVLLPMKTGLQFSPTTRTITIGSTDLAGQNFSAAGGATRYTASGYIKDSDGKALSDVSVTLGTVTVKSDSAAGFWFVDNIAAGTWQVTPSRYGYTFTPPNTQITLGPSSGNVNFSAQGQAVAQGVIVDMEGDPSGDGSTGNPFRTITAAVNTSPAGTLIQVRPGTYNESFTLKDGQTLQGTSPMTTIIDGQGAQFVVTMATESALKKITVKGSATISGSYGIRTQATNAVLSNVILRGNSEGLLVKGGNITATNCVFHGNSGAGAVLETGGRAAFDSCIISSITQNGGAAPSVDYCNITAGGYGVSLGTGNSVSDPGFLSVQTGDFQLAGSSPCINAGNPDPTRNDRDTTRNDMGAFGGGDPGYVYYEIEPMGLYVTSDGITGYSKEKLIDGRKVFNSDFAIRSPQNTYEMIFDFGKDVKISRIHIYNDGEYGLKRAIIAGAKESTSTQFNVLGTFANLSLPSGRPGKNVLDITESTCRYFKITADEPARSDWLQLNEIEFHSQDKPASNSQLSSIKPSLVTCTPTPYLEYGVDRLFNGSITYNSQFALRNPISPVRVLLDFGRSVTIQTLVIHNDGEFGARSVRVFHSLSDDDTYVEKGFFPSLTTLAGRVNRNEISLGTVNCRFLRLDFESFADQGWFQMSEIEILGSQGNMQKVTIQSANSSATPFAGYGTDKLYNSTSVHNGEFACRNNSAPVTITLDLGSDHTFNRIDHYNDGIYGGKAIAISGATNSSPTSYTPIQSASLNATGTQAVLQSMAIPQTTARYLKLEYTSFGDPNWFQLCEIEIFQEASAETSTMTPSEIQMEIQDTAEASQNLPGSTASAAFNPDGIMNRHGISRFSICQTVSVNPSEYSSADTGNDKADMRKVVLSLEAGSEFDEPSVEIDFLPGWTLIRVKHEREYLSLDWTPDIVIFCSSRPSVSTPAISSSELILEVWRLQGVHLISLTPGSEIHSDALKKVVKKNLANENGHESAIRIHSSEFISNFGLICNAKLLTSEKSIDTDPFPYRELILGTRLFDLKVAYRSLVDFQTSVSQFLTIMDIKTGRDKEISCRKFVRTIEEARAELLSSGILNSETSATLMNALHQIDKSNPELVEKAAEMVRIILFEGERNKR